MRRGRLHRTDVFFREMAEEVEADLALAELEISERVRSTGTVSADSMWETTFGGDLTGDTPASGLYNPARARRARWAAERRQQEERAKWLEAWRRERDRRAAESIAELERQRADAAAGWAQEQAVASFRAEAERTRREVERLQRDAGEAAALAQSARLSAAAIEKLRRDALFISWNAVVLRNGWSEGEAAERWHDWLTGPPGLFG